MLHTGFILFLVKKNLLHRYDFNPVCGDDGVTYFNPCFAGCINQITEDSNITYSECSCLVTPAQQAVPNSCSQSCSASLPGFIIAGIITIFFTFMSAMPSVVATLRSVEPVHRSLGLGIESIFTRFKVFYSKKDPCSPKTHSFQNSWHHPRAHHPRILLGQGLLVVARPAVR